jgi:hypothetical protein
MMVSDPPPSDSMPARAAVAGERGGPDRLSWFISAGAWAAIVSGLAVAVSLLLEWLVVPYERLGTEAYLTGWYFLAAGLRLLSGVLLVWAVIGLYQRQSRVAGTFGLWAFVVAFFGSVLQACESWGETFVWPTMAQVAPNVISGEAIETPKYLFSGNALGWISVRGVDDIQRACLSSLAGGPADLRDPGHGLSFPDAGIIPGVNRADTVRHCIGGPRFLRPEDGTLKCVVVSTTRLEAMGLTTVLVRPPKCA